MTWDTMIEDSTKIITFMETGGHSKYSKGLIHNILNANPDYALLVINAVSGITEKTIEQYKLAIALQTPCFIVVTHID